MKLTKKEEEAVWRRFCAYCIKVLDGEARLYLRELKRQGEREVCFSDLPPEEERQLCTYDGLPETNRFRVMDMDIPVKDDDKCDYT